jgi:hypothetical protein
MLLSKGTQCVPGIFMNVPVQGNLLIMAAAIIIVGSA